MNVPRSIDTPRLILRPFAIEDAPAVQRLAGDRDVASTTLTIPHPYEGGVAEAWIAHLQTDMERGTSVVFAVVIREARTLVGAVGLTIAPDHARAEMGYWIGKPYRGRGYCTEAAAALLEVAFERLGLHRVYATHFARNPASGRVMQKLGMTREGRLREHVQKWGGFEDLEMYG
ncbi:MAG: GNAT family N-acetyltransferase, partial [Gemmatimonadaceae bacterium]|nr:GNAT family N-acetyltransferase [Gemmatimonadaceae bacterium]